MIAAHTHRSTPFARLLGQVRIELSRLANAYAQHRLYRRTVSELGSLTNRELADLGLTRSEVRSIAMETVYGE